jgi:hypothetical protein
MKSPNSSLNIFRSKKLKFSLMKESRFSSSGKFLMTSVVLFTFLTLLTQSYVNAQAPTVNGLFYAPTDNGVLDPVNGIPDSQRYPSTPYAISVGGSKVYLTLIDGTLYVALVVDRLVNDNMFDAGPGGPQPYMNSGGWGSHRTARRLIDSEYAEFFLIVGEGANQVTFNWLQGYAGQPGVGPADADKTNATWISDTTVSGGMGAAPPGLISASSLMWNMNNYATRLANNDSLWTMPGADADPNQWKSPFNPAAPDDVTQVDGYPPIGQITWSATYEWEWSMVYEWSVDITQFGTSPTFVVQGSSHHSPAKTGGEDDEFPDQDPDDPPPPLMDFGDLPDWPDGELPDWYNQWGGTSLSDSAGKQWRSSYH